MKINYLKLAPYAVIAILAFLLFFKGCGKAPPKTITVKVPEKTGSFKPKPPVYITKKDTVYITRWKEIKIPTKNPVNDSLAKAYRDALDTIARYKLYLDAIQLREFKTDYEDDHLKLSLSGQVQGYLNYITPSYTIKEQALEVEVPQTSLRVLGGFEMGASKQLHSFPLKLNLGLQNGKGNIIRASYMRFHNQDFYFGGYELSLFSLGR